MNEQDLNKLAVLVQMTTELNLVNSRLIDVLLLPEQKRQQYKTQIKELQDEKKKLQKIIKEYIEK
jgi:hypothetical protein